jgi:hypothetical protein
MNRIHISLISVFLFCLFGNQEVQAQKKLRIIVDPATCYIDGSSSPYNTLQSGDTLFFQGGNKQYLQLKNFQGSARVPIVFMNINGMVTINTDFYYGIKIANCRYIRLTGTGDTKYFYGFMISRVKGGAGMSIGELSSDFEIDHIYIANCPIAGVYAKTDPDCSLTSTRGKFTQYNTVFHDNYFGNTGNEGMYLGSSFYSGETMTCDGKEVTLYPSLLSGVRVYNNIVKYSGWDGIQIGSASTDCQIMNNLVMYDSQAGVDFQMSGILIGGGSTCDCYNNYIYKGKGDAVESLGLGNYKIYNNVIVDPGWGYYPNDPSKMKYGIYINDNSCEPGKTYSVLFNDIINPKTDGIRFSSTKSKNNLIASNVIIGPGAGPGGYIVVTNPSSQVILKNNYESTTQTGAGFADSTYALLKTSPLIDAGYPDNRQITFDYFYHPRPFGNTFDIGSNEYNPKYPPRSMVKDREIASSTLNALDKKKALRIDEMPFPDPVAAKLTMIYSIDTTSDVSMDVYNLTGAQISHTQADRIASGSHSLDLDISTFPAGVCLFTLRAGREAISGRFIKVK